jgi:hypothetical protein
VWLAILEGQIESAESAFGTLQASGESELTIIPRFPAAYRGVHRYTGTQRPLFGIMRVIVVKVVMMLGPGRSG